MTRCFPYRRVPSHVHPTHICHHPFPRSPFHDRRLSFSRAPSTHYTLPRGSQLVHFGFDERDPLRHTAERRHARAQRHVYARSDNRTLPLHWKMWPPKHLQTYTFTLTLCPSPRGQTQSRARRLRGPSRAQWSSTPVRPRGHRSLGLPSAARVITLSLLSCVHHSLLFPSITSNRSHPPSCWLACILLAC